MTDKTLKQFYREIQQWIDDGCPEHEIFNGRSALCHTVRRWLRPIFGSAVFYVTDELTDSFQDRGLGTVFPFNESRSDFNSEMKQSAIYKNPARLAWIKEKSK